MDIYNYLKKDHRTVSKLFEKILSAKSPDKRETLFEELKTELTLHSETEHNTFYKTIRAHKEIKEMIEHADAEHKNITGLLKKLQRLSIEGEKWMEKLGELKYAVEHHVKEEEEDIFEKAKKVLSTEEAKQLAKKMDALKQQILEKTKGN